MPFWFDLLLPPFFMAFVLTAGGCLLLLLLPVFRHRVWRQGKRHQEKTQLSRLGGVALCFGYVGAVLSDPHLVVTREIFGLLAGGIVVCLFGLWDDLRELSFKAQGFFQVAITTILFVFGIRITLIKNPFGEVFLIPDYGGIPVLIGFLLLLSWMLLVLNAVNWLDGLDGLLGSISFLAFLTVLFLSLKPEVNQPPVAILSVVGMGSVLGFLLFNIHPARILAGTTGSFFLGFLIAVLSIIAGTKIATALLVLILPVADALFVLVERLRDGASLFQSDERHLHYKLRSLGWSEGKIAWFFSVLTAMIATVALSTESVEKFVAFLVIASLIVLLLVVVARRVRQGKEAVRI